MKIYYLIFSLAFINACGGDSADFENTDQQQPELTEALEDSEELRLSIASQSPMESCEDYHMAGDFQVVNGYNFNVDDVVTIYDDCLYETYECGTLGYLVSGSDNWNVGQLTITVIGHLFPKYGCLEVGTHKCAYVADGTAQYRFDCQYVGE